MAVVNKFNVNNKQVTLDADIIENMSANDVSYNSSAQYDENTVGDKLSELEDNVEILKNRITISSVFLKRYSSVELTTLQIRCLSAFRSVRLSGKFDKTKIYAPFVIWKNASGIFHLRISVFETSSETWNEFFAYKAPVSEINPDNLNVIYLNIDVNGYKVEANLDLTEVSNSGTLCYERFNGPSYIFDNNFCFSDTYESIQEINELSIVTEWSIAVEQNDKKELFKGTVLSQSDFISGGFIFKETGNVLLNDRYSYTDFFAVHPDSKFIISLYCDTNACIGFYDINKVYLNDHVQFSTTDEQEIAIPENAYYVRFSSAFSSSYVKGINENIESIDYELTSLSREVKSKQESNNIWTTYDNGDASKLDTIFYKEITRRNIYLAIRSVEFIGFDPSIPRTLYVAWNGNGNKANIRISRYDAETSLWVQEITFNKYFEASEFPIKKVLEMSYTSGTKKAKVLVDFSLIPNSGGSIFNQLDSNPEFIFSSLCYVSSVDVVDNLNSDASDKALSARQGKILSQMISGNWVPKTLRMFPNKKLPVVSFEFDDLSDNDAQVVELFKSYGVGCGFAFVATNNNITNKSEIYKQYQRDGFDILNHSIDGSIFSTKDIIITDVSIVDGAGTISFSCSNSINTSWPDLHSGNLIRKSGSEDSSISFNGLTQSGTTFIANVSGVISEPSVNDTYLFIYSVDYARKMISTAMSKMRTSGLVVNGWVSPSSSLHSIFIDVIKENHAYAFTYSDSYNNGRQSNPCTLTRYSLEASTVETIKNWLSEQFVNDKIITFYGHANNFGIDNPTGGIFSIEKVRQILEYCLDQQDNGLCWVGSTDECIKYYFDL